MVHIGGRDRWGVSPFTQGSEDLEPVQFDCPNQEK